MFIETSRQVRGDDRWNDEYYDDDHDDDDDDDNDDDNLPMTERKKKIVTHFLQISNAHLASNS